MKKVVKIIPVVILVITLVTIASVSVNAYTNFQTVATTSLSLPDSSLVTLGSNTHYFGTQAISFTWTGISAIQTNHTSYAQMDVEIYSNSKATRSRVGNTTITVPVTNIGKTKQVDFDVDAGTYYFLTSTSGDSGSMGSFTANPVYIYSYDN